jgi:aminopeptidase C
MLTPILIDNRISAFLGMSPGDGKWPMVIRLHERYGIVRHAMDQERAGASTPTARSITISLK